MSDTEFDVVIAAYLIPDLAQKEFDALVKLVEDKQLEVEGVVLVTVDADGNGRGQGNRRPPGTQGPGGRRRRRVGRGTARPAAARRDCRRRCRGRRGGQVRQTPSRERSGREDGRRAAARLGRDRSRSTTAPRPTPSTRRSPAPCGNRSRRSTGAAPRSSRPPSRRHKLEWAASAVPQPPTAPSASVVGGPVCARSQRHRRGRGPLGEGMDRQRRSAPRLRRDSG